GNFVAGTNHVFHNVYVEAGYSSGLNGQKGSPAGTGAFVSYYGGGSGNVDKGAIYFFFIWVNLANGARDPHLTSVGSTPKFTMDKASILTSGGKPAYTIDSSAKGWSLRYNTSVSGGPVYGLGTQYSTWNQMLDAIGANH